MADIEYTVAGGVNKKLQDQGDGTFAEVIATGSSQPYSVRAVNGLINGVSIIHKFGHADGISTSYTPVASGSVWRVPQVGSETTLRIKAGGNADDTAAGSGAREVTLYGISPTGELISEALATAGTSASAATTLEFLRLHTVVVTASGTYASSSTGSHTAAIVIENGAGGTVWATIELDGFPHGRSQIGAYTIPLGKTGLIHSIDLTIDSTKTVDVLFFARSGVLETAAPYQAMQVRRELKAVSGNLENAFKYPLGPYPALTDIGFMARGASTPDISLNFVIELIDD